MVVCRYFLNGYCRFGDSCRYEHSYKSSQYTYRAPQLTQVTQVPQVTQSRSKLADIVVNDITEAVQHNQYIMSCYSPIRGNANLPGFIDISPEETRYFYCNGVRLGRELEFKNIISGCLLEAKQKFSTLLNPSSALYKILEDIEGSRYVPSVASLLKSENDFFSNLQNIFKLNDDTFTSPPVADKASMLFASVAQSFSNNAPINIPNPTIGQTTANVFQESSMDEAVGSNAVQAPKEDKAMLIFGQASQNLNVFAQSPPNPFETNKNINFFAQTNPVTEPNIKPFSQNIPEENKNVFVQNVQPAAVNPFLSSFSFGNMRESTETIYSKPDAISKSQEKAFKEPLFHHGFIPEIAPTQELSV